MKKSLVLSGIAIASLVVCLVVKVPASFVWQKLKAEELVPASIELEGIRGTVWSGSADKVLIDGQVLPVVKWDFSSFSPLALSAGYDIQIGNVRSDLFSEGNILVGQDSIIVQDMTARIAADYFEQWLDIPFPVELQGRADIAIDEFRIRSGQCEALKGNGQLNNIEVASQWGVLNLGQGNVDLSCSGRTLSAVIVQSSAELSSSLELEISISKKYSVVGWVKADAALDEQMRRFLEIAGKPDRSGTFGIKFKGMLR